MRFCLELVSNYLRFSGFYSGFYHEVHEEIEGLFSIFVFFVTFVVRNMSVLAASNISHTYANGVQALRNISLEIERGEFVAIVGPTGCGKSTLLRILSGLLPPSVGQVVLDGQPLGAPSARVGIMFQDPALLPWRSVVQNIGLPMELGQAKTIDPSRISELVTLVGLMGFENALPRELSGGMAQRTALARALLSHPPVLLLDEPFGALDAFTREDLTSALQGICQSQQTTTLLITHNINEAVFLADRICVLSMRPGQLVGIVPVTLPRPRHWLMETEPAFGEIIRQVRMLLGQGRAGK